MESLAWIPALLVVLLFLSGAALFSLVALHLVRSQLRSFARPQRIRFLQCALGLTQEQAKETRLVGFFHPYCNAGGGGERVLWTALSCMQRELGSGTALVVYTGDVGTGEGKVSKDEILAKVEARFGITLDPGSLAFVPLKRRWLVEDSTWPRFTLLGQSLGSVLLAFEGLGGIDGVVPDVWIGESPSLAHTMGYGFAYPLVKWLYDVPVGSYTHYPTISTDMLSRVRSRTAGHTNPSSVASSAILSRAKLVYYTAFARAYAASLNRADTIMVNSTWTKNHIVQLLGIDEAEEETGGAPAATKPGAEGGLRRRKPALSASSARTTATTTMSPQSRLRVRTVYPPCDTAALTTFSCTTSSRVPTPTAPVTILSLAQFRPEKEHPTQLRAFAALLSSATLLPPSFDRSRLRLILAGSARHAADHARVDALRVQADELGISEQVEFEVNAPYDRVCELMRRASIGLHTMVDEHFGITVVEFQAAGLLTLAHASAGPLLDILTPFPSPTHGLGPTGFLAAPSPSPVGPPHEPFAAQLAHIVALPPAEQDVIRARARESAVARFGVAEFERGWRDAWGALLERAGADGTRGATG